MPSYPEQLYNSIDGALIDRFIAEGQEEHLHLDFKQASAQFSRDDRINLAVSLSGFANADGGVVVWGVDARRNKTTGADCAVGMRPITPLSGFISHLNEFTGQAVNPLVDGITHRRIDTAHDEGFAVTLVPTSDSGPHMAKFGEDRYYKRSGSRFAKMEHYEVADMFGRRRRPDLRLSYRFEKVAVEPARGKVVQVTLRLENVGRASARAPLIEVRAPGYYVQVGGGGLYGRPGEALIRVISLDSSGCWLRVVGYGDFIIHPGTAYDVIQVVPTVAMSSIPPLSIAYTIAAENFQTKNLRLDFTPDELRAAL